MNDLINQYIALSEEVISQNNTMVTDNFNFIDSITRIKLNTYKNALPEYFKKLKELDEMYSSSFKATGAINDLNYLNAQLSIVAHSREMATSSLSNFETAISNTEDSLKFRLTISLAITAIVISIISMAISVASQA